MERNEIYLEALRGRMLRIYIFRTRLAKLNVYTDCNFCNEAKCYGNEHFHEAIHV